MRNLVAAPGIKLSSYSPFCKDAILSAGNSLGYVVFLRDSQERCGPGAVGLPEAVGEGVASAGMDPTGEPLANQQATRNKLDAAIYATA
jgi:hypothetical protein